MTNPNYIIYNTTCDILDWHRYSYIDDKAISVSIIGKTLKQMAPKFVGMVSVAITSDLLRRVEFTAFRNLIYRI